MTIAEKALRAKQDLIDVSNAGYEAGYADAEEEYITQYDDGFADGYAAGNEDGYVAGKKAEYDAFWSTYQVNGSRTNQSYAFYNKYWNDTTYNPPFDLIAKTALLMFSYAEITDTKVWVDFSQSTTPSNCVQIFQNCYYLKKAKIKVNENTTYTNWFTNCTALKNITFEGTIGKSIGFAQSPLTLESAINIIRHLKDYFASGNEYSQTITFSPTTWALLDANPPDDIFDPTGAPLDWREYIMDNLCWNYA